MILKQEYSKNSEVFYKKGPPHRYTRSKRYCHLLILIEPFCGYISWFNSNTILYVEFFTEIRNIISFNSPR